MARKNYEVDFERLEAAVNARLREMYGQSTNRRNRPNGPGKTVEALTSAAEAARDRYTARTVRRAAPVNRTGLLEDDRPNDTANAARERMIARQQRRGDGCEHVPPADIGFDRDFFLTEVCEGNLALDVDEDLNKRLRQAASWVWSLFGGDLIPANANGLFIFDRVKSSGEFRELLGVECGYKGSDGQLRHKIGVASEILREYTDAELFGVLLHEVFHIISPQPLSGHPADWYAGLEAMKEKFEAATKMSVRMWYPDFGDVEGAWRERDGNGWWVFPYGS